MSGAEVALIAGLGSSAYDIYQSSQAKGKQAAYDRMLNRYAKSSRLQKLNFLRDYQKFIDKQYNNALRSYDLIMERLGYKKANKSKWIYKETYDDYLNKQTQTELRKRMLEASTEGGKPDPTLEYNLNKQEDELRQALASKYGSNYEGTTAGIQALSAFKEAANRERVDSSLKNLVTLQGILSDYANTELAQNKLAFSGITSMQDMYSAIGNQKYQLGSLLGNMMNQYSFNQPSTSDFGLGKALGNALGTLTSFF